MATEIRLDGQGYGLAVGRAGGTVYRRGTAGRGRLGLYGVNVVENEQLVGAAVKDAPEGFRRLFWGNWRGLGQRFVMGGEGWKESERGGLVADLVSMRPVLDGAALALAPQGTDGLLETVTTATTGLHSLGLEAGQVISFGDRLYVSANPGSDNTGFSFKASAPGVVTSLGMWAGTPHVAVGSGLFSFNPVSGALTAFAPGVAVDFFASYQGVLFASSGATLRWFVPAVGAWSAGVGLESAVTAMEELDGSLYMGTRTALYRLTAALSVGSPASAPGVHNVLNYRLDIVWRVPNFSTTSYFYDHNFAGMKAWRGSLWFWSAGQLMRGQPVSDNLTVRPQPLYGSFLGMAVCAGQLVAVSRADGAASSTVWVNDGRYGLDGGGWWKLAEGRAWRFPFANGGYPQGAINAWAAEVTGGYTLTRWALDPASPVGHRGDNYGLARTVVEGRVTLPMVMPEDLLSGNKAQAVQLLRVGAEWAITDGGKWWPTLDGANLDLDDSQVRFEVSMDGGQTWTFLVEPGFGNNWYPLGYLNFGASRAEFPVAAGQATSLYPASPIADTVAVADPGWLVRINWRGKTMPLLRRVWLDYKATELSAETGRYWEFELFLSEPTVNLDGQAEAEPALTRLDRLWELWRSGRTVLFNDLDGVGNALVKVVGLEQKRVGHAGGPGQTADWLAEVKLVEVWE